MSRKVNQSTIFVPPVVALAGVQSRPVAVTATADGLTTGLIPADTSVAVVTSAGANNIVTLPAATAANTGAVICVIVGANGCEMRTPAASGEKINNVDSDGTNELALPANTHYLCRVIGAGAWTVRGFTILGADAAALVPDAA